MISKKHSKFNILFSLFLVFCLAGTSCKPPLPVYFDAPIGTKVQGFDTSISGNYIPLEDVIDKGMKEFAEKYEVKHDKIMLKQIDFSPGSNGPHINDESLKDIMGAEKDTGRTKAFNETACDSLFNALCNFGDLTYAKIGLRMDKQEAFKPKAGMIKIAYDRVYFISVDSLGNNRCDTLLSLIPNVLLTRYAEKYFLNFKTEYGWEILQLDMWENNFLSVRPFYFTDYNECPENVSELTASTKNIYPDLKPIFDSEKKVVGFKAALIPKTLAEKFKKSQQTIFLLRLK